MLLEIPTLAHYLGNNAERYFAEGFRNFQFRILSFTTHSDSLSGKVYAYYTGSPRPRGEEPHIGSIEYIAFFQRLATHALNQLGLIGLADCNSAFLSQYSLRSTNNLHMGEHDFHCEIVDSWRDQHSEQGSKMRLKMNLGGNFCQLEIDYRSGGRYRILPDEELIPLHMAQLHSLGYKQTGLDLSEVKMNLGSKHISCAVVFRSVLEEGLLNGIGSSRHALLASDATRIFGQLLQALYYETAGTNRLDCPNIWLRKMELSASEPQFNARCEADVYLDNIREVKSGAQSWKLIALHGSIGNYQGKFEVAHQVISS